MLNKINVSFIFFCVLVNVALDSVLFSALSKTVRWSKVTSDLTLSVQGWISAIETMI